ncbi:MAG: hypothetical protein C0623_14570 [Desulfuromonas sp.]|nr:MAG: hypothetical protein C0623_14570 [Desulfuromonas sp.]
MARTFIGADIDNGLLRMVALEEESGVLKPVALIQREAASTEACAAMIAAILAEWDSTNSRLAAALPASVGLTRNLEFPFGDRRKIASAVPLELGARLPISLDDYFVTSLDPVASENQGYQTTGLAVPKETITDFLDPFNNEQLPLRHLGILPFAYADGFVGLPDEAILLDIRSHEISSLLLHHGQPRGHRILIRSDIRSASETIAQIGRDIHTLQKRVGRDNLPIRMFGPGLDKELEEAIRAEFPEAEIPEEYFEGERLAPEYIPALALARLAAKPRRSYNLRQGEYAYRGSLAPYKKQLIAITALLSIALTTLIGGAWLAYTGKAAIADQMQKQMQEIYRQTFPRANETPKDVLLHMTSRLNAARNRSNQFGAPGAGPLPTLAAISKALPENSSTVIEELNYDETGIRLTGKAPSFDTVDQLAAGLGKSTLFSSPRIGQAKTSIDGKQIEFRIDLGFAGKEGAQ